jgi:hypothetical protein
MATLSGEDVDALVDELKSLRQRLASTESIVVDLQLRFRALENRPALEYRGVWSATDVYPRNVFVTCSGSIWASLRQTCGERPGDNKGAWMLACKRGRDGADHPAARAEKASTRA